MRRRRQNRRMLTGLLAVLVLTLFYGEEIGVRLGLLDRRFDSGVLETFIETRVDRVIDGDTVRLTDGTSVRLIGINAPETTGTTEAFGVQARAYARETLEGKRVYLERDVSETDRFGRALGYLWLERPEKVDEASIRSSMFNARILQEGFAQPHTFPPDVRYADLFMGIAREARDAGRGLWGISRQGTTRGTAIPD